MNAADVIGYVEDGEIYCPSCAHGTESPIFADGETDTPSHCAACEAYIPESLTREGVRYVTSALREYLRTHGEHGRAEILREWAEALAWYGGAAHHIAHRFLRRHERYEHVADLRKRFAYAGGGYAYRWSSPLERPGGGTPSSLETDPEAEVCGECGGPIFPVVSDETRSNGGTEWAHEASGIDHEAYPFDPADVWETVIAPAGEYRPLGCARIDGTPCVVFEHAGETYAITEASAHRPAEKSSRAT